MNANLGRTIVIIMRIAKIILAVSPAFVTQVILEMDSNRELHVQTSMSVQTQHFPTIAIFMLLARIQLAVLLANVTLAILVMAKIVTVSNYAMF